MRTPYAEVTVLDTIVDYNSGNEKLKKFYYIGQVGEVLCELEYAALKKHPDGEVQAIKRSNVIEIVNERGEYENSYKAQICEDFLLDSGEDSVLKYEVLIWADDSDEAKEILDEYLTQGHNDKYWKKIALTNIKDLIL